MRLFSWLREFLTGVTEGCDHHWHTKGHMRQTVSYSPVRCLEPTYVDHKHTLERCCICREERILLDVYCKPPCSSNKNLHLPD